LATYYHWKSKYAGVGVPEPSGSRELDAENAKLKRKCVDLAFENSAIRKVQTENSDAGGKLQVGGTNWAERDAPVIAFINTAVAECARWVRKCFDRINHQTFPDHPWNHKRVYRAHCQMKLNLPRGGVKHTGCRDVGGGRCAGARINWCGRWISCARRCMAGGYCEL
jgi:hypothetical protein